MRSKQGLTDLLYQEILRLIFLQLPKQRTRLGLGLIPIKLARTGEVEKSIIRGVKHNVRAMPYRERVSGSVLE